jgi:hypothetical protein
VIDNSICRVRIHSNNMVQVRRDTIHEWSGETSTQEPVPVLHTNLEELLEADGEYRDSASLHRLCYLVAELIHRWEKLEMQSRRMSGFNFSHPSTDKGKHSRSDQNRDHDNAPQEGQPSPHCEGWTSARGLLIQDTS